MEREDSKVKEAESGDRREKDLERDNWIEEEMVVGERE